MRASALKIIPVAALVMAAVLLACSRAPVDGTPAFPSAALETALSEAVQKECGADAAQTVRLLHVVPWDTGTVTMYQYVRPRARVGDWYYFAYLVPSGQGWTMESNLGGVGGLLCDRATGVDARGAPFYLVHGRACDPRAARIRVTRRDELVVLAEVFSDGTFLVPIGRGRGRPSEFEALDSQGTVVTLLNRE